MKYWLVRIRNYIHGHKRSILFVVIVLLLMSLSFALGYITARDLTKVPIIIQKYSK